MTDVVVTVPKSFTHPCAPGKRGLQAWVAEGDAAGEPWSGTYWGFTIGGPVPKDITPGDRVYIVCEDRLRGYAPLVEMRRDDGRVTFVRGGDAVAVTLLGSITGFRGWRYRWWEREDEIPFPEWRDLTPPTYASCYLCKSETGPIVRDPSLGHVHPGCEIMYRLGFRREQPPWDGSSTGHPDDPLMYPVDVPDYPDEYF